MWYQLSIAHCGREHAEQVEAILENAGALSITYLDKNDEPMLEPEIGTAPVWRENIIQALFNTHEQATAIFNLLKHEYNWMSGTIEVIDDQDWQRAAMDLFQPQAFGKHLWICPSWITPPEPNAINVILDPGLAFGTGTHPTTALCLEWLANTHLNNLNMVDYGCGSGILAIAAIKLGAQSVHAVDLDDQALQATLSNATINQIAEPQLQLGLPNELSGQYDLVVANILLGPLISLKENFYALLKSSGTLVLSGLLNEQTSALIQHYQPEFTLQEHQTREDWACLVLKRQ